MNQVNGKISLDANKMVSEFNAIAASAASIVPKSKHYCSHTKVNAKGKRVKSTVTTSDLKYETYTVCGTQIQVPYYEAYCTECSKDKKNQPGIKKSDIKLYALHQEDMKQIFKLFAGAVAIDRQARTIIDVNEQMKLNSPLHQFNLYCVTDYVNTIAKFWASPKEALAKKDFAGHAFELDATGQLGMAPAGNNSATGMVTAIPMGQSVNVNNIPNLMGVNRNGMLPFGATANTMGAAPAMVTPAATGNIKVKR